MLSLEQPALSEICAGSSAVPASLIPFPSCDVSQWARQISDCIAKGRADIRDLAQILSRARAALSRGEWSSYWDSDDAPFSKRKGEMLVRVGKWLQELNANTCSQLPFGWRVLYVLSRLEPETVSRLVESGAVDHELTFEGAKELVATILGDGPARESSRQPWLAGFYKRFLQRIPLMKIEELRSARLRLQQLTAAITAEEVLRDTRPDTGVGTPYDKENPKCCEAHQEFPQTQHFSRIETPGPEQTAERNQRKL